MSEDMELMLLGLSILFLVVMTWAHAVAHPPAAGDGNRLHDAIGRQYNRDRKRARRGGHGQP